MNGGQLTYDEVMLDWAIAELFSPTWQEESEFWKGAEADKLRAKVKEGTLNDADRSLLIREITAFRNLIIPKYGPHPSWSFRRVTISSEELSRFSIIHQFGYLPSFSFGALSTKIKDNPTKGNIDEQRMRNLVHEIIDLSRQHQEPIGLPIAIEREAPLSPLLIEGYKRAMAALWDGRPSIEIYLCTPPAQTRT
jgi:hypothetical protein